MAYQKLQVGTGIPVIKSDTVDIPYVSGPIYEGTLTQTASDNALIDETHDFTALPDILGAIVECNGGIAYVIKVNSSKRIKLSEDIMDGVDEGDPYKIYTGTNPGCVLYVGTGGSVRVLTSSGADLTFENVANGTFLPVQVKRVFSTGTDAGNIIALW